MKNPILLSFILFLLFTSCNQTDSHKNHSNTAVSNSIEGTISPDTCFSSYQIFTETAFMWQASWVSYYNSFRGGSYEDSPRVFFDEQNLNILYDEVKQHEYAGILIWYTLLNPNDSIPSLAIQNTVACNIDPAGTILLARGNNPNSPVDTISPAFLETIKTIWSEVGESNPAVYTAINGYNYEWESIQDLMDLPNGPQGLYIHYGLRTIAPDESEEFASTDPDKTGSIIYCNVIYGENFEVDSSATLLDFAMPCPRFCGDIK